MPKDYTEARYWAISSIGYGKGFTYEEAVENYVATQTRSLKVKDTIFKSRAEMVEAFTTGDCRPMVFHSPEGYTGFHVGMGSQWVKEVDGVREFKDFEITDRVYTPGGEYKVRVKVSVNDFDGEVVVEVDGASTAEAMANAEAAVVKAQPYVMATALGLA